MSYAKEIGLLTKAMKERNEDWEVIVNSLRRIEVASDHPPPI